MSQVTNTVPDPLIMPGETPRSSTAVVNLPSGYLDDAGTVHDTASIREMTGVEEDLLTASKTPIWQRMQKILENCVTQIGTIDKVSSGAGAWSKIVKSLPVSDRLFLIVELRKVSLGKLFSFKAQCTNSDCRHVASYEVDLDTFKINGLADRTKRAWEGTLPRSGYKYLAKTQTGEDEERLDKVAKDTKDLTSLILLGRLIELNGQNPVTLDQVKKLSMVDREHLRKDFRDREGSVEDKVDVTCSACGTDFQAEVEIGTPGFFFPTAT